MGCPVPVQVRTDEQTYREIYRTAAARGVRRCILSFGSCPTSPERTGQCSSSELGGGWLGGGGRCCHARALGLGGGWRYQRGMLSMIVHWDVELLKNACIQHHFGTGTFCERCKLQLLFHSRLPLSLPYHPPFHLHLPYSYMCANFHSRCHLKAHFAQILSRSHR